MGLASLQLYAALGEVFCTPSLCWFPMPLPTPPRPTCLLVDGLRSHVRHEPDGELAHHLPRNDGLGSRPGEGAFDPVEGQGRVPPPVHQDVLLQEMAEWVRGQEHLLLERMGVPSGRSLHVTSHHQVARGHTSMGGEQSLQRWQRSQPPPPHPTKGAPHSGRPLGWHVCALPQLPTAGDSCQLCGAGGGGPQTWRSCAARGARRKRQVQ